MKLPCQVQAVQSYFHKTRPDNNFYIIQVFWQWYPKPSRVFSFVILPVYLVTRPVFYTLFITTFLFSVYILYSPISFKLCTQWYFVVSVRYVVFLLQTEGHLTDFIIDKSRERERLLRLHCLSQRDPNRTHNYGYLLKGDEKDLY